MSEIWKEIPNYPTYRVSNIGRIKCVKFKHGEHILKSTLRFAGGYLGVCLSKSNVHKTVDIHRMVAQAFIPNPFNKKVVNHIDFDHTNNNVENLEWVTVYENTKHSASHNRMKWKLSDNDKREIIKRCLAKTKQYVIAKDYNIDPSVISRLFSRAKRGWTLSAI